MNAKFFALALLAALNPKLLAVDLLLIENRRPRAMFGDSQLVPAAGLASAGSGACHGGLVRYFSSLRKITIGASSGSLPRWAQPPAR